MSCEGAGVFVYGPDTLFAEDTAGTIHVVAGPMSTASIKAVRAAAMEMMALTAPGSGQLGYQLSNDQATWYDDASTPTAGAVTLLGSALTSVTTGYGVGFTLLPQNSQAGKLWIRFVVVVSRTSGTGLVAVRVTGRIETRSA